MLRRFNDDLRIHRPHSNKRLTKFDRMTDEELKTVIDEIKNVPALPSGKKSFQLSIIKPFIIFITYYSEVLFHTLGNLNHTSLLFLLELYVARGDGLTEISGKEQDNIRRRMYEKQEILQRLPRPIR